MKSNSVNNSTKTSQQDIAIAPPTPAENGKFVFKDGTRYEGSYLKIEKVIQQEEPVPIVPQGKNAPPVQEVMQEVKKEMIIMRHGFGINTCGKTGFIYEGDFEYDMMDGSGKLTAPSGVSYQGGFAKNKFQGQGVYTWEDGSSYTGSWDNGSPHGPGAFLDKSRTKQKWVGQFYNGSSSGLVVEI